MKKVFIFFIGMLFYLKSEASLIIPNLQSTLIGERGSVLGGAIVARADDASAAHYNPAGVAMMIKDSFSASGSTFSSTTITETGVKSEPSFNSIASFVGNVWKFNNHYLAFTVSTPLFSQNSAQEKTLIAGDLGEASFVTADSTKFSVTAPGLTYATSLDETFRFGASLKLYLMELTFNGSGDYQLTLLNGDSAQGSMSLNQIHSMRSIRGEFGIQKDISANLRYGLTVKLPPKHISSKGKIIETQMIRYEDGSSYYSTLNTDSIESKILLPIELHTGLSYIGNNWDLELNIKYSGDVKNQKMTSTKTKIDVIERDSAGSPIYYEEDYDSNSYNFKKTLNYSLSGSAILFRDYLLSFGAFTDFSPSKRIDPDDDLFTAIDLYGGTLGITKFSPVVTTTLGIFYIKGSTSFRTTNVFEESYTKDIRYSNTGVTLSGSVFY